MIAVSIVFLMSMIRLQVRKIKDSSLKKTCYYLKETIRWAFSSWPIADTLKMKCKTTVLY